MRFFKIILFLVSLLVTCAVVYVVWFELSRTNVGRIPYSVYIYLGIAFASAIINILYHIKSFRFYRRKEKRRLHKNVHKILWVGTICFSAFLLYIAAAAIYSMIRFIEYGYNKQDLVMIIIFLLLGFFGLLEASLLKKRIRRLRSEHNVLEEIDNIGKEMD